jgi:hypothetical protein
LWFIGNFFASKRLFSFSNAHGPSFIDFIGILILLSGYLIILLKFWNYRGILKNYANNRIYKITVFLGGFGSGILVASVAGDFRQ